MDELLKTIGTIAGTSSITALTVYLTVQRFIRNEATQIVNGKIKDHKYECQTGLQKEMEMIRTSVARIEEHINGKH